MKQYSKTLDKIGFLAIQSSYVTALFTDSLELAIDTM